MLEAGQDLRGPLAGVVDEDLAHGESRRRKEMVFVVPSARPGRELQIGLVDQGRGVQGLPGSQPPALQVGQAPELVVDGWQHVGQGAGHLSILRAFAPDRRT